MSAAVDQSFLMQLVEHAHERDRLDAEPGCDLGLADPFVPCDVENNCRLLACDRQPHLPSPMFEAPLDQPRDVVDEKAKGATDLRFCRHSLEPGWCRDIFWLHRRPCWMRNLIRRHDGSPPGLVSERPPPLSAIGIAPNNAAKVVIMIGRKRNRHAWWIASRGLLPSSRSACSAKSIIMIAFFLTMPISRMTPISAIRLKSMLNSISARTAPTPAEGSVERIVIGWM